MRRRLAERLEGRVIDVVSIEDPRWCSPVAPESIEARLEGRRIDATGRRGKYLIWELAGGDSLVMHLRMTGSLLYDPEPGTGHQRVEFSLSDGHRVVFCDPRRFGTGDIVATGSRDEWFASRLGPEPFDPDFDAEALFGLTRGRNAPLKSFLLDQRRVAGLGNIYADEALHRAGLHPLRRPATISRREAARLHEGIVDALLAGIDAGGATIDDFRDPDGAWGAYQSEFLVHRREGLPCPGCAMPIVRFVVGGRSTYCCESCQPRPRRRAPR